MFFDFHDRSRFLDMTKAIDSSELWLLTRLGAARGLILFGTRSRVFIEIRDRHPESSTMTRRAIRSVHPMVPAWQNTRSSASMQRNNRCLSRS